MCKRLCGNRAGTRRDRERGVNSSFEGRKRRREKGKRGRIGWGIITMTLVIGKTSPSLWERCIGREEGLVSRVKRRKKSKASSSGEGAIFSGSTENGTPQTCCRGCNEISVNRLDSAKISTSWNLAHGDGKSSHGTFRAAFGCHSGLSPPTLPIGLV